MPGKDYVPDADADFDSWQQNLLSQLKKNKTRFALADATETSLGALQTAWQTSYAAHLTAQTEAAAKRAAKDDARKAYIAALREQVRQTQNTPGVTDADRAGLGLNPRDTTRTTAPVPTSRPVATIEAGLSLRHTINFFDEGTPNARRKPDGVHGCEIWRKIGDPAPTDPAQMAFVALDTATPYVTEFDGADAGKTAYYRLRWVNTRGEAGPWSQLYNATIAA
ncbi:MAG TPA: hypothetical protein VF546_17705 [Pyrinomonadaceae bacterium]|jgi:hypothetical protein